MEVLSHPPLPPDAGLFFDAYQPPLPRGPLQDRMGPPFLAGPPAAFHAPQVQQQPNDAVPQQGYQQPPAPPSFQQVQIHAQQQQPGSSSAAPPGKRKKRGRRGSGLEARARGGVQKQRGGSGVQLGFFGQVPSLNDLRQENWRRTQQHYGGGGGGPPRPFSGVPKQQHGPGRPGSHRRARSKAGKLKMLHPPSAPRPRPLTPAAGNPLDTPANVGTAAAEPSGPALQEVEGLQAGLDWYGTNENSAALFLAGQQLTTSDSEGDDYGDDFGEDGSDGEAGGSGGGGSGGGGATGAHAGAGGDGGDGGELPRHLRARLVEQEAYIAELEDQNLRLREQLEMAQQEVDELRARAAGVGPVDSEEGWAEHSEGSLPGDLSVMQQQQQHSQHHASQAL